MRTANQGRSRSVVMTLDIRGGHGGQVVVMPPVEV